MMCLTLFINIPILISVHHDQEFSIQCWPNFLFPGQPTTTASPVVTPQRSSTTKESIPCKWKKSARNFTCSRDRRGERVAFGVGGGDALQPSLHKTSSWPLMTSYELILGQHEPMMRIFVDLGSTLIGHTTEYEYHMLRKLYAWC